MNERGRVLQRRVVGVGNDEEDSAMRQRSMLAVLGGC